MIFMIIKPNYLNKLVDKMSFANEIPEEELKKVHKQTKTLRIKKDEYFLRAGDIPKQIGYIKSGLMRLYYIDYNGNEVTKHFCLENTLAISYSSFLQQVESKLYIQAIEDTKLLAIDYKIYLELLAGHNCWQILAKKLAEMLFILLEKRESELLLNSAQERYLQFLEDYPDIEKRLNQYHIASYLNIAPESLSRIRKNLK